jgi:hypothetical protein
VRKSKVSPVAIVEKLKQRDQFGRGLSQCEKVPYRAGVRPISMPAAKFHKLIADETEK